MENEKLLESLKIAGFTDNERTIYLTLLDYGLSKIGRLIKITGMQKSSGYLAINMLVHKGVVSSVSIGKVAYYAAENPVTILQYLDEKRQNIKSILPELEQKYKQQKTESGVKHFKGIKGVKAVLFDILRDKTPNDVFGSEGQLSDKLPTFTKQFIRMQNENNIKTRNLIGIRGKRKFSKGTTYRFVDKEIKSNVVTNIYGNKIAIIMWTEEPEAVILENKAAANSYRSYFEFMWKNAKKTKHK